MAKQIASPDDVTSAWLASCLGLETEPDEFSYDRVGTGQMSECYRFKLGHSANTSSTTPLSVILKVASRDLASKSAGVSLGLYQREVLFYQEIAPMLNEGGDAIVECYHASYDEKTGSFCLLLADAAPCQTGDDLIGTSFENAKTCLEILGHIHGDTLRTDLQANTTAWLKREQPLTQAMFQEFFKGFVARYRDMITVEHLNICARFVRCYDAYKEQQSRTCTHGLLHGDFRLDNLLLSDNSTKNQSRKVYVLDWQTVAHGPILGDVAYFLGSALPTDMRRQHMEDLIKVYFESVGSGTQLATLEQCYEELRTESFFGLAMVIASSMLVERTERGDRMFLTMLQRHCDLVLDLKAVETLPETSSPVVLQAKPEDEYLHPQGQERLFNESYYFDFVDPEQEIGVYVRLGITPNTKTGGWYLAVISRPGKPAVYVTDYTSPIAGESLKLSTHTYMAEHNIFEPLKRFNIRLHGEADLYNDVANVLQAHPPDDKTNIKLDLTFNTDGIPYHYRMATRYEIPCLVDGTVSIGDDTYTISQQVGQRDHSWGVRNWWNMDWLWSAIHLQDGSHIHLVDLQVQGQGPIGVGYYQTSSSHGGLEAWEVHDIATIAEFNPSTDLIEKANLTFSCSTSGTDDATQFRIAVEVLGHGPLRLVSELNEVAFFNRAWCKCTLDDGRIGYGWLEWNRVQ